MNYKQLIPHDSNERKALAASLKNKSRATLRSPNGANYILGKDSIEELLSLLEEKTPTETPPANKDNQEPAETVTITKTKTRKKNTKTTK